MESKCACSLLRPRVQVKLVFCLFILFFSFLSLRENEIEIKFRSMVDRTEEMEE